MYSEASISKKNKFFIKNSPQNVVNLNNIAKEPFEQDLCSDSDGIGYVDNSKKKGKLDEQTNIRREQI